MERRVIVIVGPTASGKTALAIAVAKKLDTEIISADSRQFYKMLDIGTAKPTEEELASAVHHFIDTHDIADAYNVSKFEEDALAVIRALHEKEKIPVVVGGSGLYVRAVVDGIMNAVSTDEEYREKLKRLREEKGNEYLHGMLSKVDPITAAKMLPQNWKRVMRALEVFHLTGKSISELQKEYERKDNFVFYQFGLRRERAELYARIERRVDEMFDKGLIDEAKRILAAGYDRNLNALNTVGYKEVFDYLEGKITLERAKELIKRNTRRFAKRQMTWFGKDERIKWLDADDRTDYEALAEKILETIEKEGR
jgi:tRNA dimethylallyltransferase